MNNYEEKLKQEKAPIQYKIYKGVSGKFGALRMNLKKAWSDPEIKRGGEGVIFLEMAPAVGKNQYDWQNQKMVIALSVQDISKIILYLRAPQHPMFSKSDGRLTIFHDKGAGTASKGQETKTLTFAKYPDRENFFVSMSQKDISGARKEASIPMSPDEAITMTTLFQSAIPSILAWA
jgi:hypothetical protein